ncbi:hypothetical protein CHS0354_040896 [Potamilus streckersoni]|uniref:Uncharacterized protein n=1 Tax=Potamilus streckersoni TaxID=2493646 RepID=A0AAE0VYQ3_9BIVA|nr:hypothetical protein CHS0354_040896 [Potamilus streckersoni]
MSVSGLSKNNNPTTPEGQTRIDTRIRRHKEMQQFGFYGGLSGNLFGCYHIRLNVPDEGCEHAYFKTAFKDREETCLHMNIFAGSRLQ